MKLNLGCGNAKRAGWVNADKFAGCAPDQIVDLEVSPWPWADSSVTEVALIHALEHLGATTDGYLGMVQELWRVCVSEARIEIVVPHPRSDAFLNDPTHVRAITPDGLALFDRALNREWGKTGAANTPLGLQLDVDFAIEKVDFQLTPEWHRRLAAGEVDHAAIEDAIRHFNNVCGQIAIVLRAKKPLR